VPSVDDGGDGRHDQEGVGEDTDEDTDPDGLEATPLGVCDDTTSDGNAVAQEGD
jgi:hypothetical protein